MHETVFSPAMVGNCAPSDRGAIVISLDELESQLGRLENLISSVEAFTFGPSPQLKKETEPMPQSELLNDRLVEIIKRLDMDAGRIFEIDNALKSLFSGSNIHLR